MSSILNEFEVIPLTAKLEPSYVTITGKGLKFSLDTDATLEKPGYIHVLMNQKGRQIAIQACRKDDDALEFTAESEKKARFIQIKHPQIISAIGKLVNYEENGTPMSYKVKGMAYPDERAIIYSLDEAESSVVKPRGRRKASEAAPAEEDDVF